MAYLFSGPSTTLSAPLDNILILSNLLEKPVCVCLCCSGVAKAWSWAHFGQGSGPILLDAMKCTGNELFLDQCPHGNWEQHNCDHMEDAGVSCSPYTGTRTQTHTHIHSHT